MRAKPCEPEGTRIGDVRRRGDWRGPPPPWRSGSCRDRCCWSTSRLPSSLALQRGWRHHLRRNVGRAEPGMRRASDVAGGSADRPYGAGVVDGRAGRRRAVRGLARGAPRARAAAPSRGSRRLGTPLPVSRETAIIVANARGTVTSAGCASSARRPARRGVRRRSQRHGGPARRRRRTIPAIGPGAVRPRHQMPSSSRGRSRRGHREGELDRSLTGRPRRTSQQRQRAPAVRVPPTGSRSFRTEQRSWPRTPPTETTRPDDVERNAANAPAPSSAPSTDRVPPSSCPGSSRTTASVLTGEQQLRGRTAGPARRRPSGTGRTCPAAPARPAWCAGRPPVGVGVEADEHVGQPHRAQERREDQRVDAVERVAARSPRYGVDHASPVVRGDSVGVRDRCPAANRSSAPLVYVVRARPSAWWCRAAGAVDDAVGVEGLGGGEREPYEAVDVHRRRLPNVGAAGLRSDADPSWCQTASSTRAGTSAANIFSQYWKACTSVMLRMPPASDVPTTTTADDSRRPTTARRSPCAG